MSALLRPHPTLPAREWQSRRDAHLARLAPVLTRLRAYFRAGPHPVYDFLRTYYSFPLAQLENWSPGIGVCLENAPELAGQRHWSSEPYSGATWLNPADFPAQRREGLRHAISLLVATAQRPGQYGCFGLHEWAMVYRQAATDLRHQAVPLRLSPEDLAEFVEGQRIRCSHWDAFRFFTTAARPLNTLQPGPGRQVDLEQPACLHANMDLYKWAYKFHPWVPSEILAETFLLALEIRELDMRASPYDLSPLGFAPVQIETAAGRAEYEAAQREFAGRAATLRQQLMASLNAVETALAAGVGDQ